MLEQTLYFIYILPSVGFLCTRVSRWYFLFKIGSVQPTSSNSDFIENKTTEGGSTMILSMLQSLLLFLTTSLCNALSGNIRPHIEIINAVKLN